MNYKLINEEKPANFGQTNAKGVPTSLIPTQKNMNLTLQKKAQRHVADFGQRQANAAAEKGATPVPTKPKASSASASKSESKPKMYPNVGAAEFKKQFPNGAPKDNLSKNKAHYAAKTAQAKSEGKPTGPAGFDSKRYNNALNGIVKPTKKGDVSSTLKYAHSVMKARRSK
jgi:hypothetical protein